MPDISKVSDSSLDYLKSVYLDATNTIRHYDGQRASFTTIFASLLSLFTSIVTAATLQGILTSLLPFAAGIVTALSVLSLIAVLKFGDLIELQRKRAAIAMRRYQQAVGDVDLMGINIEAKSAVRERLSTKIGLNTIWIGIFAVLTVANFLILCLALRRLFI